MSQAQPAVTLKMYSQQAHGKNTRVDHMYAYIQSCGLLNGLDMLLTGKTHSPPCPSACITYLPAGPFYFLLELLLPVVPGNMGLWASDTGPIPMAGN